MFRERPADQRADDAGDGEDAAPRSLPNRSLVQGDDGREDDKAASQEPRGSDSGDGTADDEGVGVGGEGADEAAELEDADVDYVDDFSGEEGVDLAGEGLGGAA